MYWFGDADVCGIAVVAVTIATPLIAATAATPMLAATAATPPPSSFPSPSLSYASFAHILIPVSSLSALRLVVSAPFLSLP